jgi:hypothetical protein
MVGRQLRSGALIFCLLLAAGGPAPALEKTIELGKDKMWADVLSMDGVTAVPGRWGFHDLVLSAGEYAPDSATELLLHFDGTATADATGAYSLGGTAPVISPSVTALGGGSAAFTGKRAGLLLSGPADGMFAPGAAWADFSIEFWLYPATLSDGETVVSWNGFAREGASTTTGAASQGTGTAAVQVGQSLRCYVRDRKLTWDFQGLFELPGGGRLPVTLAGTRQLLPRAWHHHLLRFNSREGLLEYRIDGVPEAIVHTTDTGSESGSIAVPIVGHALSGPLAVGERLTGFLDELRISRRFVEDPALARFSGAAGAVTTTIIDLGHSSTRVVRIDAVTTTPADTGVAYFYQAANAWNGRKLLAPTTAEWTQFTPGTDFKDTLKTRFLQIRVELYPDGSRTRTPHLSDLSIVFEPNVAPPPPAGVVATPGNGKVTLAWRAVKDLTVKGYKVYYGTTPHNYLGTGAGQGDSPLEAGTATTITIDGLANGSLYTFAVTAYDDSEPRQESEFSAEVSARPSRIYK